MDDQEMIERFYQARRMARKLASNRSRSRVVRKLPRVMVVEVKPKPPRPSLVRRAINANKRLTYILLLGMSLGAYIYDVDPDQLLEVVQTVEHTVEQAAQSPAGG